MNADMRDTRISAIAPSCAKFISQGATSDNTFCPFDNSIVLQFLLSCSGLVQKPPRKVPPAAAAKDEPGWFEWRQRRRRQKVGKWRKRQGRKGKFYSKLLPKIAKNSKIFKEIQKIKKFSKTHNLTNFQKNHPNFKDYSFKLKINNFFRRFR